MSLRKNKAVEHELTWCYYRMKRHALHPERKSVGDPHLPKEDVVEKMRSGTAHQFQFWRDLRPPFHVVGMRRDTDEPNAGFHPDGDLFHVSYQCGIDYVGERLWNEKSNAGTFDNLIHGVATIRIPEGYPQNRQITIITWGHPSLNYTPEEQFDEDGLPMERACIDPNEWMPIADELGQMPNLKRFAACRMATRKANKHRPAEVAPMQALLLGPHATLPQLARRASVSCPLAAVDQQMKAMTSPTGSSPKKAMTSPMGSSPTKVGTSAEGMTPSPQRKKRSHRIFTSAAGFVCYAG